MEKKIALTGISFEYNTIRFYEYNDLYMVQFFKCLLGSNVLKPISEIIVRYEADSEETFYLKILPDSGDNWIVDDYKDLPVSFKHNTSRNLLDEVEELLPANHFLQEKGLVTSSINT
jgi:hypothetical protein